MVYFQTKNPNLGKFWTALDWKMLIYLMAIWNILGRFRVIWYILGSFGIFPPILVFCTMKNLAGEFDPKRRDLGIENSLFVLTKNGRFRRIKFFLAQKFYNLECPCSKD
jgi:hypothetical protein